MVSSSRQTSLLAGYVGAHQQSFTLVARPMPQPAQVCDPQQQLASMQNGGPNIDPKEQGSYFRGPHYMHPQFTEMCKLPVAFDGAEVKFKWDRTSLHSRDCGPLPDARTLRA